MHSKLGPLFLASLAVTACGQAFTASTSGTSGTAGTSSGATSSGATASGATSSGASSSASSGSGSSSGMCPTSATCDVCKPCALSGPCLDEKNACGVECATFLGCVGNCGNNPTCAKTCENGVSSDALKEAVAEKCCLQAQCQHCTTLLVCK